jgi:hypothetical protein
MPRDVNASRLADYETMDTTIAGREMACTAGACELAA